MQVGNKIGYNQFTFLSRWQFRLLPVHPRSDSLGPLPQRIHRHQNVSAPEHYRRKVDAVENLKERCKKKKHMNSDNYHQQTVLST